MKRKILRFIILALAVAHSAFSQTYTIQTFAGRGWDMQGVTANLSSIRSVAVDDAGNAYMALLEYSVVVRMGPSGTLTLVAGDGTRGYSGDNGPATLAQLDGPFGVAVDSAGTIYFKDIGNNLIRKVSNGVITTVAGGGLDFPGDNVPAISARLGLNYQNDLAVDTAGNLYFVSFGRIFKVSNGVLTTMAGFGGGLGENIPALGAFVSPAGIAVDAAGNVYIADTCLNRIRKVSHGVITTVAGNGTLVGLLGGCAPAVTGGGNGPATSVSLNIPHGITVDAAGNVYFMEEGGGNFGGGRARKVSNGIITTVAGGNQGPPIGVVLSDNIPATSALLNFPEAIAVDTAGNLYITDGYVVETNIFNGVSYTPAYEIGRLRKVSNGVITTVAGAPGMSGENGPPTGAQLNLPAGVALDAAGNLYLADSGNNVIRKVSNGAITTVAGNRIGGFRGDGGPATSANVFAPRGIAVDAVGNFYIGDSSNGLVRKVSNGLITTLAGQFNPAGIALDAAGNLYIADQTDNRIQKISNGAITTVAGDGTLGFGGDNGLATSAQLAGPSGVALDSAGDLYFTDRANQRVRKVSNGVITTVAGNGTAGFSGDNGPATSAELNLKPLACLSCGSVTQLPAGIALDAAGNIYIVDSGNQRVRMVSNGIITTVAGNGTRGYSGDNGPALSAQLNNPSGLAVDAAGKIYVADSSNNRIRVLIPASGLAVSSGGVVSSASYQGGGVSPGEILTVFGSSLGPANIMLLTLDQNGRVATKLGPTRVLFDGVPGPMIYTLDRQVSAIAPFSIAAKQKVNVQVEVNGVASAEAILPVVATKPAIFSTDQTGKGQGAILNQDFSRNGASNPAVHGSVVQIFMTGGGVLQPPGQDGELAPSSSLLHLSVPVSAKIGGIDAVVQFSGAAPFLVLGVVQVNVFVPAGVPAGNASVEVIIGGVSSQPGVTVAIK